MAEEVNERLVRAARELLRWDQTLLAEKADVGVATVRRFETGAQVRPEKVAAISHALRNAGVAFIGAGVSPGGLVEGVALTTSARPLAPSEPRPYGPRKKKAAPAISRRAVAPARK